MTVNDREVSAELEALSQRLLVVTEQLQDMRAHIDASRAHIDADGASHAAPTLRSFVKHPDFAPPQAMGAKIDHHTRAPHQPTYAVVVEGDDYALRVQPHPDGARVILQINGAACANIPLDNLVKAATRIDPENASPVEAQIRSLRAALATSEARRYEAEARATIAEDRLASIPTTAEPR